MNVDISPILSCQDMQDKRAGRQMNTPQPWILVKGRGAKVVISICEKLAKLCFQCFLQSRGIYLQNAVLFFYPNFTLHMVRFCYMWARVAEVGVLAETAKYPFMLARSTRLQIFATKNTVFYNCKFLQHKRCFFVLALTAPHQH